MKPKQSKKRKKERETFLQDTSAVSEVVGFVLILGILLSVTSIYIAQQIPKLTKEFEVEHAAKVTHDFASLSSTIDMAVLSEDTTPLSANPIEMRPESVLLLGIYSSGGTLRFNPSLERFDCIASAPGETAPPDGIPPPWSSTPTNFTAYDRFQVVTPDRGAELKLEIGEDKTISTGKQYLAGAFRFNHFVVPKNARLYTSGLIIYARDIIIESGAEITADGRGAAGGVYDVSGKGQGAGLTYANNDCVGGGGAGHGGAGGAGGSSYDGDGGAGGSAYGDPTDYETALPGSGGGGGSSSTQGISQWFGGDGGDGGGSILLHAPVITIAEEGTLSVNGKNGGDASSGDDSAGGGGGGGSGGCILLRGDNVTVSGRLSANGGNGGDGGSAPCSGGGGGGGAGGIIKIFYDSHFANTGMVGYVNGGNGGDQGDGDTEGSRGVNGTTGVFDPDGSRLLYSPEVRYYDTGYLTSNVTSTQGHVGYDTTTSFVCYCNMTWKETVDEDTNIIMKVRTSMKPDMSDALPWEECLAVSNGQDISELSSVSDGHRYIQWRAELVTDDLAKTPVLHSVNISYEYCLPFLVTSSGSIRYSSQYLNLPNYKLVYEHGAIIKNQTDGEFMLQSPPISIIKQGDGTKLIISSINLTGVERTSSGGFQTTIKPSYRDSALITSGLNFLNLTINITTDYPTVWKKWFNDTCKEAELEYGTNPGKYFIHGDGTSANPLQVIFYGNETRPVNVWLKSSEARIEIEKEVL